MRFCRLVHRYIVRFTTEPGRYISRKGRKETEMANRKKQEVFVPALSEEMKECPLIIRDIGATVSGYFEVASEVSFANEEDEQIIDLLIRLYIGGRYHEAVMLLRVVFSLIEYEEAQAILSLIHEKNGSNTEELFINRYAWSRHPGATSSTRRRDSRRFPFPHRFPCR